MTSVASVASGVSKTMTDPPTPWYRQFWPWFIIALPAASVVFSFATLAVAVRNADSLVRDDYYKAGLGINRDFALERVAAHGGLAVEVRGSGIDPHSELLLALAHPTDAARDQVLPLRAGADGIFRSALAAPLRGPWNATLTPAGGGWRLVARIDFDAATPPQLGAPG